MIQLAALASLVAITASSPVVQSTRIEDYVQNGLKDATFVARVVKADQRELKKINDDFGASYRFESTTIRVMEPFKLRLEASVEDTNITYVVNGTTQVIKIPRAKINSKQNLSRSPGRRQTLFDFGILTPSLFESLFDAKFVRNDRATGDIVFDVTYKKTFDDTTRHRIWVDSERKIVTKREWFGQSGRQMATFLYEAPKQESGVWMPTRLIVKNAENVTAGTTRYDSIKVNSGIAESLFSVDR